MLGVCVCGMVTCLSHTVHLFAMAKFKEYLIDFCFGIKFKLLDESSINASSDLEWFK